MNYWAAEKIDSNLGFLFSPISPAPPDTTERNSCFDLGSRSFPGPRERRKKIGKDQGRDDRLPGFYDRDMDFFSLLSRMLELKYSQIFYKADF